MVSVNLASLNRNLPDRKIKLFIVGIGLAFWGAWGIAMFFLVEGHPLSGVAACGPLDGAGIFWECASNKLHTLLATSINALIVVTLAMPMFVVAANIDPALFPLALPGILFHAIGLPAGLFVLVRSLRRIIEHSLL